MTTVSGIRAGGAYVEIGADSRALDRELEASRAKLTAYTRNLRDVQKRMRAATDAGDTRQAATLQRVAQGMTERKATLREQIEGRGELQARLGALKAEKSQRTALEEDLFRSTHGERENALRDTDQYFARLRAKWTGNQKMLTLIQQTHAAKRQQVNQQFDDQQQEATISPWLRVLAGRKAAKFGKLMGAAGTPVMAAAVATKAVGVGAEIAQDAFLSNLYESTGQLDKAAEVSLKWADNLGKIPVVGTYISQMLAGHVEQQKQIIADFARIRHLSGEAAKEISKNSLQIRTAHAAPYARRMAEIQAAWKEENYKGAELEGLAAKYAPKSDEARVALAQAKLLKDQAAQKRKIAEEDAAADERRRRAAEDQAVLESKIALMYEGPARRRAELAAKQAAEIREASVPGSGVDMAKLAEKHANEQKKLQQDLAEEQRQEAYAGQQAQIEATQDGFARELAMVKLKHAQEIEEYDRAGKDKTALVQRQAWEEYEIRRRAAQQIQDLATGLLRRLTLATGAATGQQWEWFDLSKQLQQLGATRDQIEAIYRIWQQVNQVEANKGLLEQIQDLDLQLQVATGRMSQLDAEMARLARQNSSASPETLAALRQWKEAVGVADFAKGEKESLKTPGQKLQEYIDKLQQAVSMGYLNPAEMAALAASRRAQLLPTRTEVRGTFNAMEARGLGAAGPIDRIAAATEATARNTEKLLGKGGQLVFSGN